MLRNVLYPSLKMLITKHNNPKGIDFFSEKKEGSLF